MVVRVGDKVRIPNEKKRYTVMARSKRYIICTKYFNLKNSVKYFIVDLKEQLRGPDDQVFCSGYETLQQCQERLEELESGLISLSQRRSIDLDIDVK